MRKILIATATLMSLTGFAVAQNVPQGTNPNCSGAAGTAKEGTGMGPQCEGQRPVPSTGVMRGDTSTPPSGPGQTGHPQPEGGQGSVSSAPGSTSPSR